MKLKSFLIAAAMVGFAGPSYAVLVDCPASFTTDPTAKVEDATGTNTAASDCEYISPADNNNVANETNVNTAGFFGFNDWEFNGTNQQLDGGGGATGTWAIQSADFANEDYMIVFKDGDGTNLIAFLLNELYDNGVWSTPFVDPPFDLSGGSTSHGVSHYSIFERGGTTNVSEPSVLALFGLSLLLLGFLRRRTIA